MGKRFALFAGELFKSGWCILLVLFPVIPVQAASEHVHPEGYKVLILMGAILLISIFFLLRGSFGKNSPRERITIRVQMYSRPGNGIGNNSGKAFLACIANKGSKPVEILAPVIRFGKGEGARSYRIKSPGKTELYPLYLSPGTDHEFRVDLRKFYEAEPSLTSYKKLSIVVSDRHGRELATWYANNMQTKKSYMA